MRIGTNNPYDDNDRLAEIANRSLLLRERISYGFTITPFS